jgi:hypothetical protein
MQRALLAGVGLLLAGAIAAREKTEPLIFVFLRVERGQNVTFLRPMIAPDIGVQLVADAPEPDSGSVLRCVPSTHTQPAIVNGQVTTITELVLTCGDHKFIVKGLDFYQRAQ